MTTTVYEIVSLAIVLSVSVCLLLSLATVMRLWACAATTVRVEQAACRTAPASVDLFQEQQS